MPEKFSKSIEKKKKKVDKICDLFDDEKKELNLQSLITFGYHSFFYLIFILVELAGKEVTIVWTFTVKRKQYVPLNDRVGSNCFDFN